MMANKETGRKAAFQSRRWVACFIRPALVCLETGNLGMTTKQKRPQGDSKKPAMGCLFKWPTLVCLETGNPG